MPHRKILEALGMTPAQWGALPPEPGTIGATQCSNVRNELKVKAMEIIRHDEELVKARSIVANANRVERAKQLLSEAGEDPDAVRDDEEYVVTTEDDAELNGGDDVKKTKASGGQSSTKVNRGEA